MQKEEWINEVLNSAKGIQKAEAPAFLFEKIVNKIEKNKQSETKPLVKWALAACALIFISINLFSVVKFSSDNKTTEANPYDHSIIYSY